MSGLPATSQPEQADQLQSQLQHFRIANTEQRFTIDGSAALEQQLTELCDEVLAGVQKIVPSKLLQMLVLGGGYGRGQGGVLRTEAGDAPYNDLEFYVFLRGNRLTNERRFTPKLNSLGEELSSDAGLHVEFKVDSLARLRSSPATMFSYDLVSGHRILFAPDGDFSGCEHHRDAGRIPLEEATRLLFNRCTGLLLAKEMLLQSELNAEQNDFVGRNLAKAQLALGDVILAATSQYHWSVLERGERMSRMDDFEKMPWLSDARRHHAAGVEFKLHPRRVAKSVRQFTNEHVEISNLARQIWLWVEGRRCGERFASARDYAFSHCPVRLRRALIRNALLNARVLGLRSLSDAYRFQYPRERLFRALPVLLWEEPLNDLKLKRRLQMLLRTSASDWHSLVAAYKKVWPRFS
jgi:hypothetical protein